MQSANEAAEVIARARRTRLPLQPLDPHLRPLSLSDAYAVQQAVHERLAADHGAFVGYKIGCTSKIMRDYLQIHDPCSGGIFEKDMHGSGVTLAFGDYVRVGVECEIAIRLGSDLTPSRQPFTCETLDHAVETVCPAIEIVDDRYAAFAELGAPTLVADDFFAAGVVLGRPVQPDGIDLSRVRGRLLINGVEVGRGTGADVMEHPYKALAWLANSLASRNTSLKKGQVIMTGSMVRTMWLGPGDHVQVELTNLGGVEATFR